MPIYEFACGNCGHTDAIFKRMAECRSPTACPECGRLMDRDFESEAAGPHTEKEFFKPIEMHSIALNHHDDIMDFKRRNPDVDISTDPEDELYGVPIARSRKQKLDILKAEGFVELS